MKLYSREARARSIVFLNQAAGSLIRELVNAVSERAASVAYCSASQPNLAPAVKLIRTPRHRNSSIAARAVSWMGFLLISGWTCLAGREKPLLFIVTNPPWSPLLGFLAKRLRRRPYILLYYDVYPEVLERFLGIHKTSLVSRVFRLINRLAIQDAEHVIAITPQMAKTLTQYEPQDGASTSVSVIPTWVDTGRIYPLKKELNWFATKYGQIDKFTVLYSGHIGEVHDLTMLPSIAHRLRDYPAIEFMIIGEGAGQRQLLSECKRLGAENVSFLPLQKEETVPFSLATGDLSIVSLAEGAEGLSMPSKTYYMMAAGTALLSISTGESDLATVVNTYECGRNIAPGDVDGAVSAILDLYHDSVLLKRYRVNARKAAEDHFSLSVCTEQVLRVIESCVGEMRVEPDPPTNDDGAT